MKLKQDVSISNVIHQYKKAQIYSRNQLFKDYHYKKSISSDVIILFQTKYIFTSAGSNINIVLHGLNIITRPLNITMNFSVCPKYMIRLIS